jgi:hypothetical protein
MKAATPVDVTAGILLGYWKKKVIANATGTFTAGKSRTKLYVISIEGAILSASWFAMALRTLHRVD